MWVETKTRFPGDNVVVDTKKVVNGEEFKKYKLYRQEGVWYLADTHFDIFYEPTHWRTTT